MKYEITVDVPCNLMAPLHSIHLVATSKFFLHEDHEVTIGSLIVPRTFVSDMDWTIHPIKVEHPKPFDGTYPITNPTIRIADKGVPNQEGAP